MCRIWIISTIVQFAQMRDLAIDFELLDEHLVLLGNQVRLYLDTLSCNVFINACVGCWKEQDRQQVVPGEDVPTSSMRCVA
jgi:hypothetical protein